MLSVKSVIPFFLNDIDYMGCAFGCVRCENICVSYQKVKTIFTCLPIFLTINNICIASESSNRNRQKIGAKSTKGKETENVLGNEFIESVKIVFKTNVNIFRFQFQSHTINTQN